MVSTLRKKKYRGKEQKNNLGIGDSVTNGYG